MTVPNSDEHGAVSVLVALLMVVLLGFAALAVDVGMLYSEKAQLQNGADAAALGIAQTCAKTPASPLCSSSSAVATELTNRNSLDNLGTVKSVALAANEVTVTTTSKEASRSDNRVSLFFAQALGYSSAEVSARSHAEWGSPTSGPAPYPVVFSECELRDGPGMQLIEFRKKSNSTPDCAGGPPGGFGNLDSVPGRCAALVDISHNASGSNNGNKGVPNECSELLTSWKDQITAGTPPIGLFPIYDSVADSGNNAVYSLIGFAAFEVYGWKLKQTGTPQGLEAFRNNYYAGYKCTSNDCIGIIGKFVRMVSLDSAYTFGSYNPDMGAVVRLTLEKATP